MNWECQFSNLRTSPECTVGLGPPQLAAKSLFERVSTQATMETAIAHHLPDGNEGMGYEGAGRKRLPENVSDACDAFIAIRARVLVGALESSDR